MEWQPIETAPEDGELRLYAIKWSLLEQNKDYWEVYALYLDDEGDLREMSGDAFYACGLEDFSHWAQLTLPDPPKESSPHG